MAINSVLWHFMRILKNIQFLIPLLLVNCIAINVFAQTNKTDTINLKNTQPKQEHFYDSLKYKASQKKVTYLLYDFLVSPPRQYVDKKALALNYYSQLEGKIISEIDRSQFIRPATV